MVLSAMLSFTMAVPSTVGAFIFCNVIIVVILINSTFKSSSDVQEEPAATSRFKDRNNTRLLADESVDDDTVIVVADHEVTQTQDGDSNALYCSDDVSDQKIELIAVDEVSPAANSLVVDSKLVVCKGESSTSVKDDDTNVLFFSNESKCLMTANEVLSPARTSSFTENQLRIRNDDNDDGDDDNNDENSHENCDDELRRRSEDFIEQVVRQWKAERLRRSYCVQVE